MQEPFICLKMYWNKLQEKMKGKLIDSPYSTWTLLKVIPLKLFLDHSCSKIPGEYRNNQSCGIDVFHVDSPSGSVLTSILHESIHAKRVVRLSTEELGTMSKYGTSMNCLGINRGLNRGQTQAHAQCTRTRSPAAKIPAPISLKPLQNRCYAKKKIE